MIIQALVDKSIDEIEAEARKQAAQRCWGSMEDFSCCGCDTTAKGFKCR